jgi:hypothetical protein
MWESSVDVLEDGRTRRVSLLLDKHPVSYADVLRRWAEDDAAREYFLRELADAPFAAYFWETPPVTRATLSRPFEFVLVDSPHLAAVTPEPEAFASQYALDGDGDGVVTFPNVGGDAILVVPRPLVDASAYAHLAAFVRGAPQAQKQAFVRCVSEAMRERLSDTPAWLSTAGLGVSWLHARLDSWPKYYRHVPYKKF